jgi:hypothetical protein
MNDVELKDELARVVALLARGAEALLTFKGSDGIIRDTSRGTIGLTSSHRTLAALAEAQRVLRDQGKPYQTTCANLADTLKELWRQHYVPYLDETVGGVLAGRLRLSADNGVNLFTDAHLVCGLAYAGKSLLPVNDDEQLRQAEALRTVLAQEASARLSTDAIGKISDSDSGHDFVTLWAVRAVDVASHRNAGPEPGWGAVLGKRVRNNVLQQLGWHAAGVGARFDPGELAFGLPLLQRFFPDEARPLAARGIEVMAEAQTADGAWPGCRIVTTGTGTLLHITSYEIALTLATWLDQRDSAIFRDDTSAEVSGRTLDVLSRAFRLAETSYTDEEWETDANFDPARVQRRGWSNDRTRGQGRVESWVTAIVVTFLARYYDVLSAQLQRQILARYEVRWPHLDGPAAFGRQQPWPDLIRSFGPSHSLPSAADLLNRRISDPTDAGTIGDSLAFNIVEPILTSPNLRPRNNSLSFVLPGPPGSRKTSLVASVAFALQWPLLVVSPPTFLLEGLDGLERRAAQVFEDLTSLRRVVVLFDECEELFRDREPGVVRAGGTKVDANAHRPSAATRTAGAFITTGMLPRLQALHDRAWAVFALAFNGVIGDLDPAAIRPGRFDYTVPLEYPTLVAQIRYVTQQLSGSDPKKLIAALEERSRIELTEKRNPALQWVALNEVVDFYRKNPQADQQQFAAVLEELDVARPPHLTARPASA